MIANIIHNSKDKERKDRLTLEFHRQKWVPEVRFWPAVFLEKPYMGIMEAHKQVVRWAKENNEPCVWIMEDDIRIPNIYGLEYFLENQPDDFDIYLGGIYSGSILQNNLVHTFAGLHCYLVNERFYDKFLNLPPTAHLDRALRGKGRFVVCNPFAAIQHNGFSYNTGKTENYDHHLTKYKIHGL